MLQLDPAIVATRLRETVPGFVMVGLARDLGAVKVGTQPIAFTSEWFKTRQLPIDWEKQRKIIAVL